ncbi:MAG: Glycosyltransferase involved in cell wall bioproteini [Parcubacteria group bacterium Gr01-1014_56]|nr:MAG: Glycosyltransferase involved in cell wall bioproteini [Parcubacteria group bacterium Gr01-1014_56]
MLTGALGVYLCLFLALYFEVFLLISFLEKKPALKTTLKPRRLPTVSIIVPSFNEERTIVQTLTSLLGLEYPKDKLEILVVDDGSQDGTRDIVAEYTKNHPQIKYFYKENGGKYTALNFGITYSTNELVGCLDADSFVSPDALTEVVKKFEEDASVYAIMPAMKVSRPRSMLEHMQAVEYTFGVFYKKMFDNIGALNVLPGPFSIYRREVFDKIGLFHHAHNTEDMEIAFRMHHNGLKIVNAHNATVYTTVPRTLRALLKQRARWSQGFLENSRDYSYMYLNPKYGNFGMLVLPFGLSAFFLGLYITTYLIFTVLQTALTRALNMWATGVPVTFHFQVPHFDWFFLNTSMMTFAIIAVMGLTITAILLGNKIVQGKLTFFSYFSYFTLFGFIAPMWLARALWGAARSRPAPWR